MAIKIGRATLEPPEHVTCEIIDAEDPGLAGPFSEEAYILRGWESSATVQAAIEKLTREAQRCRRGGKAEAVYVIDDNTLVPEGYYAVRSGGFDRPGGAPKGRPWQTRLVAKPNPNLRRQAEDDNESLGVDTADIDAEEEKKVVYTPTTVNTTVLTPRQVTGAEKLNLRGGRDYRAILRCQSRVTVTQQFQWRLIKLDGTGIALGAQKTVGAGNNDKWLDIDLGVLTLPAADDKANWYELNVQATAGQLNDVWLDHLRILPA